ncbi:MAG: FAD-binding oxidoreductase [Pseudomonadota bacterium]|nr:FAD-binding oxidoreductase [Pseudomonadota bacterium]
MKASAAKALAAALESAIAGEVRFDAGAQALYSTDASNYRQIPIGIVIPRTLDDIVAAVECCREHDAPLLMRGAGTSLAGQTCNVAVVLDTSKYLNRVLRIDAEARSALVEPGVVCDILRIEAEKHGLTFGPDPATHSRCTLGGMIGNNSCGAHSLFAGKTAENIEALEVLTYDGARFRAGETSPAEIAAIIQAGGRRGEIYRALQKLRDDYADAIRGEFPTLKRRVSGYNLDQLLPENGFNVARALVGSEGTCAITLTATTRLVASPPQRVLVVLGYADIYLAADRTPALLEHAPICLEGLDERMIADMRKKHAQLADIALLPEGRAWLLVEFGAATQDEAIARAQRLMQSESRSAVATVLYSEPAQQRKLWSLREVGAAATNSVPGEPETYPGWEDAAVRPEQLGQYLRDFRKLLDRYNYQCSFYGHFGDGCIHGRITFDFKTAAGIARWREFLFEAADLVVRYGGSLSGEHGDGQARAELLGRMYSPRIMQAFREFKAIWDPRNRMNPGKLIAPYGSDILRVDENLRAGPAYHPFDPATHFSFSNDGNSIASAARRCVGVAKCRSIGGGTMCPSYRATGEEQHSTRGRARLLFEMLQSDGQSKEPPGLWQNEHVKEALDLCLACKACKSECPVQVDMASYKAEFLSHYFETKRRPRQAYAMGQIRRWAELAAHAPWLANFFTQTPGLSAAAKAIAGIARERHIPAIANQTFARWFARCGPRNAGRPRVILWPDTFNNHFQPHVLIAATEVLEAAGYEVTLPRRSVCCGRPLYDFGWLTQAKGLLEQTLTVLGPEIEAGIPVIGLEPACVATFRDELLNFFPNDERAAKLNRATRTLAEFLIDKTDFQPPPLNRRALVHMHCHQNAVLGTDSERTLLTRLGLDYTVLDSGCCGMAGAFGFDENKFDVSLAIGERVLLPAVRGASEDTLIISDGYSCGEQIAQAAKRRALHTAEVVRLSFGQQP